MITIKLERNGRGHIVRFTVSGHAYYGDPGKDIVCAGVSAVTVGTVNAVEKLTGLIPEAEARSGYLSVQLPPDGDIAAQDRAQLLLEGMVVALMSIVESYGKYVKIKQVSNNKGG